MVSESCSHEFVQPPVDIKGVAFYINTETNYYNSICKVYYNYKVFYVAYKLRDNGIDDEFDDFKIYPFIDKKCFKASDHHVNESIKASFALSHITGVDYLRCDQINFGLYDAYFFSKWGKIKLKHDNKYVSSYIDYAIQTVKI